MRMILKMVRLTMMLKMARMMVMKMMMKMVRLTMMLKMVRMMIMHMGDSCGYFFACSCDLLLAWRWCWMMFSVGMVVDAAKIRFRFLKLGLTL